MRSLGVLFVAVSALCAACKRGTPAPPPPRIVEVRVIDGTPKEEQQPLDLAALTEKARVTIGRASGMAVTDGGPQAAGPRYKLRVEVRTEGAEDDKSGKGVMRALVQARLSPVGAEIGALSFEQSAVAERVYALKDKDPSDPHAAWRAHTLRAVEDVVRGAGARARLQTGDGAALALALDGKDEDLREEAIRIAGERRERAVVPQLVKLLKSEDPATRDRAIGALSTIGDARAVKPLTEVARFRDLSDLPKILDAVSAIGGDQARVYLEFVTSGHESSEMRDLAKQALGHLERRERLRDLGPATTSRP